MFTITFYDALERKIFRNIREWDDEGAAQDEADNLKQIPEFSRVKVVKVTQDIKRLPTFTDL
jgi:hypothetical protein